MQVLKFGGTSVGSPERMRQVADLIENEEGRLIVVLSAVSGTTNKLVALSDLLLQGQREEAHEHLVGLTTLYADFISQLFTDPGFLPRAKAIVDDCLGTIADLAEDTFRVQDQKIVLAQGELLSTQLFHLFLESLGISSELLPALEFMRIDAHQEPDLPYIQERLELLLDAYPEQQLFITQGYICLNAQGAIDNLQRGGSDYTATLIGAAIDADEVQIWTDIDGIHNNDPRVVQNTWPVRKVSYREAAELAYFGAKILHPTCVIPAEQKNVPIRLKNTFAPEAPGTLISSTTSGQSITAIAAKDGITAIKIRSGRMLNAYGFLRKVFEVFEKFRTPIDMITTSEVSVSLTIDNEEELENILRELRTFGQVFVDHRQTIICIVGDALNEQQGYTKKIFTALEDLSIRMVSYGGSNNNISLLISEEHKNQALKALHRHLFPASAPKLIKK